MNAFPWIILAFSGLILIWAIWGFCEVIGQLCDIWDPRRTAKKIFGCNREFAEEKGAPSGADLRTKTVCAWCGTFLKGHHDARLVSHGICLPCKTIEEEKAIKHLRPHGFWEIKDQPSASEVSMGAAPLL